MKPPSLSHPCALGLGCVTFGREIDPAASFAMMDYAMAQGITLFDTASAYSSGGSETIVGDWLRARGRASEPPQVATKILPPYTAEAIQRAVSASLGRLAVSSIDLLFLHRWDESLLTAEAHETLDALLRKGTVRTLGLSNVTSAQLSETLPWQAQAGATRFSWVQNIHNFAVRGFDEALRRQCHAASIRLMGYSPLGAGFLTGKHREGVVAGSRFDVIPGHQAVYFTPQARGRLARLEEFSRQSGHPPVELALAWAVHQPWIAMVLAGGRTPDQISQLQRAQHWDAGAVLAALDQAAPGD